MPVKPLNSMTTNPLNLTPDEWHALRAFHDLHARNKLYPTIHLGQFPALLAKAAIVRAGIGVQITPAGMDALQRGCPPRAPFDQMQKSR
jgi:hypothetical protein